MRSALKVWMLLLLALAVQAQEKAVLRDPGTNGVVKRTGKGVTAPAVSSDITGLVGNVNDAGNVTTGTLNGARLPQPSPSVLGGVNSFTAINHQFLISISTTGQPTSAQPACSDLSNSSPSCSTDTTNAANIISGILGTGRMPALTGDTTTIAGFTVTTTRSINGTTVPFNTAPDQVLGTVANQTGAWILIPPCLDTAGNHLNYNTGTHAFSCGNSGGGGGGGGSFNVLTSGTNAQASMVVDTGASITTTGNGFIAANRVASSAGLTASVNAQIGFDATSGLYHIFNNGSDQIVDIVANTVKTNQANTYSTGLQNFAAGTMKLPTAAGAVPTTAGLVQYDSTSNDVFFGNGTQTNKLPWFTGATPTGLPKWGSNGQQTAAVLGTDYYAPGGAIQIADIPSGVAKTATANTYTAGAKQTFGASATTAGVALAGVTADPSVPASGDLWFRSDTGALVFRNGTTSQRAVVTGEAGTMAMNGTTGSAPTTPSSGTGSLFYPTSGGASYLDSAGTTYQMPVSGTTVVNNGANAATTGMTLNMTGSTGANALRIPSVAGGTASADAALLFDSTGKLYHGFVNSADATFATTNASSLTSGTLNATLMPALTGDTTTSAGTTTTTTAKINGTSVLTNSTANQTIVTTAGATSYWADIPPCTDSGGNHLNYNTTSHQFACGTSGGTAGSAAFNSITGGTNVSSAAMLVGSTSSLAPTGTGTITANLVPSSAGATTTTGGQIVFDSTGNLYRMFSGGADAAIATTNAASLTAGTLPAARMPALTGDVTASSGTTATTVVKINGTSVLSTTALHQALVTTASATGTWRTIPDCTDASGNHLNYTQSSDAFSCGTTASNVPLNGVTNPSGNTALAMAANTTTFTFGATTGSNDLFKWVDTTANTGTGALGRFSTASGSAAAPWQADANGVGWKVDSTGKLTGFGSTNSGKITMSGSTSGSASLTVPAIAGTPNDIQLPAATAGGANYVLASNAASPQVASWIQLGTISGSVGATQMPALTGDVTSSSGTVATTVAKVNGTVVPTNSAPDQTIVTSASATGLWSTLFNCTDTNGQHVNYATSTHTFSCGTSNSSLIAGNFTVAGLPAASTNNGKYVLVTDGANGGDCTVGGSTFLVNCLSNGTTWSSPTFLSWAKTAPSTAQTIQSTADVTSLIVQQSNTTNTADIFDVTDKANNKKLQISSTGDLTGQYTSAAAGAAAGDYKKHVLLERWATEYTGVDATGATDSTVGLQNAFADTTVSTIRIPKGTYSIQQQGTAANALFTLHAGQKIIGEPGAVLQVKANSGDYSGIFKALNVSDVTIEGLVIDANMLNNPFLAVGGGAPTFPRQEFQFFGVTNARLAYNTIKNSAAVNTFDCNPCVNAVITGNIVSGFGDDGSHLVHDTSVVYCQSQGGGCTVTGNVFQAANNTSATADITPCTSDGVMTNGSPTLTCATGTFKLTHIGTRIVVPGNAFKNGNLTAVITDIQNAHSVTLSNPAVCGGGFSACPTTANPTISMPVANIAATTAIEMHGYPQVVTGNTVFGFINCMNITGADSNFDDQVNTSNNSCDVTGNGIELWSNQLNAHTTGYGLNGATISANTVRVRQIQGTSQLVTGIACNGASNLPWRNVNMTGNTVVFDLEKRFAPQTSSVVIATNAATVTLPVAINAAVGDYISITGSATTALNATYAITGVTSTTVFTATTAGVADGTYADGTVSLVRIGNSSSIGMGCYAAASPITMTNTRVSDNVIDNAPVAGIRFVSNANTMDGLQVTGNIIRDAGTSVDTKNSSQFFRYPLFMSSSVAILNASITNNHFIDDLATSVMAEAVNFGSGTGSSVVFRNNQIELTGATTTSFVRYFAGDANMQPFLDLTIPANGGKAWAHSTEAYAAGSNVFDGTVTPPIRYVNTGAGNNWVAINSGIQPQCHKAVLGFSGTNWTVTYDNAPSSTTIAMTSGTTQGVTLQVLPAGGFLNWSEIHNNTAWAGTGYTAITMTTGDSVGGATGYTSTTYDMTSAPTNTNFFNSGALDKHFSYAGSTVQMSITANQGISGHPMTTGSTEVRYCYSVMP